jgi:hypothetical protein
MGKGYPMFPELGTTNTIDTDAQSRAERAKFDEHHWKYTARAYKADVQFCCAEGNSTFEFDSIGEITKRNNIGYYWSRQDAIDEQVHIGTRQCMDPDMRADGRHTSTTQNEADRKCCGTLEVCCDSLLSHYGSGSYAANSLRTVGHFKYNRYVGDSDSGTDNQKSVNDDFGGGISWTGFGTSGKCVPANVTDIELKCYNGLPISVASNDY